MTYNQLLDCIEAMTLEQRECDVTVEIDDECYPATLYISDDNHDSLEKDHPVLKAM